MKIIVVCQYFYPEEFKVNELVEELVRRGNEVTVLTGKPTYPRGPYPDGYKFLGIQEEDYKGARVIRVPELTRGSGGIMGIAKSLVSFLISSTWYVNTHQLTADVIICFQLSPVTMANAALVLKKKTKAKLLHWIQDLWPESVMATTPIKGGPIIKVLERFVNRIYRKSDYILVQSKSFVKSICKEGNYKEKIIYAPNWADRVFTSEQPSLPVNVNVDQYKNDFVVMFAGNIGEAQDFDNILKAADCLQQHINIKFLIVGDGRYKNTAEKIVAEKGLRNVVFLGRYPVNYMPSFFEIADAMLVTLKDDFIFSLTIPSKMQVYMAMGKPILTMLNGEGNEIVSEAGCGLTATSGDYKTLANNILLMSKLDKHELKKYGENGKRYYSENFKMESIINRLEEIF